MAPDASGLPPGTPEVVGGPISGRQGCTAMAEHRFVTAINCMDGRVQEPVFRWMTRRLAAHYVDMITEPGPDAILATGHRGDWASIERRVQISVNTHGSKAVAVVGHHDCSGNPVPDEVHQEQIRQAAALLRRWNLGVRILGLWVSKSWAVEVVCDSETDAALA
jgi:hypothetical protein